MKKEAYRRTLSFDLTKSQLNEIQRMARKSEMSKAAFCRAALQEYVDSIRRQAAIDFVKEVDGAA